MPMMDIVKRNAATARSFVFGDPLEPENRYLNLDGTPYGAEGFARHISSPYLKIRILGVIGSIALETYAQHKGFNTGIFKFSVRFPLLLISQLMDMRDTNQTIRLIPSGAVIDKRGQWGSNPSATMMLKDIFQQEAKTKLMGIGLFGGLLGALEKSPGYFCTILFAYGAKGMWQLYAAYQLNRGKWTVKTDPPSLGKKVGQAIPDGLKAGI